MRTPHKAKKNALQSLYIPTTRKNKIKLKEEIRILRISSVFYCLVFRINFASQRTHVRFRVTESKAKPFFRSVCPICAIFRPAQKRV